MAISVGWGSNWETLVTAINDYYGGGVSGAQYQQVTQMLNSGNYTMAEMEGILSQIPEFDRVYNANGELVSVAYRATATGNTTAGAVANTVNSNIGNGVNTQFKSVQNITKDANTGKVTMSDSVTKYTNGTAGTAKVLLAEVGQGIVAASAGVALGKGISQTAYNLGFNWLEWAGVDMESLNPETWRELTKGDNSINATLFNMLLGLAPDTGNPQAYLDERAVAYMASYMAQVGAFGNKTSDFVLNSVDVSAGIPTGEMARMVTATSAGYMTVTDFGLVSAPDSRNHALTMWKRGERNWYDRMYASDKPYDMTLIMSTTYDPRGEISDSWTSEGGGSNHSYTFGDKTVYYSMGSSATTNMDNYYPRLDLNTGYSEIPSNEQGPLAWTMIYGTGGIDGVGTIGEDVFDASGISDLNDIDEVLRALQDQYPELWQNRVEVSPDGDTIITYIPVGFPTGGTGQQPTTDGASQNALSPDIKQDGVNATDALIKTLIELLTGDAPSGDMDDDTHNPDDIPKDPNGEDTGSGTTPPIVIPVGSASALYSIYNPTQAQINSLGAWLWSSNFVDQLLKLFSDPMQAIIGLHKVFASPPISGVGNIKVGYLDSGVSSNLVSAQYTEVDCGNVKLSEYFKNALDYVKTDIYLYLPFVGIVPLNVEDVMRATINVKYKVDVITGACLATVNVTRDSNAGGQLYAYAGNCAVQYPLSSGSYVGIISGALGIAGSIAGTVLSGGTVLPMALGVGASALSASKTRVEHSGSFSGNAGAMGIKKPYLIIRRPQTKIISTYNTMYGGTENVISPLSSFSGVTRVDCVHLENIPATKDELTEIENLLKSGVVI